jgi:hypothetical protein
MGDHLCEIKCNKSTSDQTVRIHQILEKKWEYNVTVHQLLIDFEKAYDSMRRNVLLYNMLTEIGITMKLVRLVKIKYFCPKTWKEKITWKTYA